MSSQSNGDFDSVCCFNFLLFFYKITLITSINFQANTKEHPSVLIPELCRLFYGLGWVTGTGGGISIKQGLVHFILFIYFNASLWYVEYCHRDEIYIAPSGVQKERMTADDLFIQDINGTDIKTPSPAKKLKKSQCTPLFMCAYKGTLISNNISINDE